MIILKYILIVLAFVPHSKMHFCSLKQKFMLLINLIAFANCETFSLVPSINNWQSLPWYNTLISLNFNVFCWLLLSMLSKVYRLISVSFGLVQNFEISDLAMAKVEKVNIAVAYDKLLTTIVSRCHIVAHINYDCNN